MNSDSDLTDLSSELSSVRSSPSPPPTFGYPSPQSSQENTASVCDDQQLSRKRSLSPHGLPPAKKRRSTEAAPRQTVHLDLRSPPSESANDQTAQLNLLLKTLRKRRKIVVVAGAGISTSAGSKSQSFHYLLSGLLNCTQFPIFALPMVFSKLTKVRISSNLLANSFSMRQCIKPMTPHRLSTIWCAHCRRLSVTPNPPHFMKC